jgi:hypothetical protein
MDAGLADQSLKAGKPVVEQAFNNSFSSHALTTLDRNQTRVGSRVEPVRLRSPGGRLDLTGSIYCS